MSVISGSNKGDFISSDIIYAKVRRFLKSFVGSNLIDEGEFPVYTGEILHKLGISAMEESEVISEVVNGKTKIPDGLVEFEAIYKCTKDNPKVYSNNSIVFDRLILQETICETFKKDECNICCEGDKLISRISVSKKIESNNVEFNFINPMLLRLSPNVKDFCSESCLNMLSTSPYEVSIKDGYLLTNFDRDYLYIKFYKFPLDEKGLPKVPNIIQVIKAIETYIIYQVLLGFWYNSDVPDIQNKWQKAEQDFTLAYGDAVNILKTPAFSTIINYARSRRSTNMLNFFNKQFRTI